MYKRWTVRKKFDLFIEMIFPFFINDFPFTPRNPQETSASLK